VPFVALSPCRLADTRAENGFPSPFGPPSMSPEHRSRLPVGGHCGVPVDAAAVSFNFTVVRTQGLGYLAAYPQGEAWGGTSSLNYVAGQIVANNAVIALGNDGRAVDVRRRTPGRPDHRHQRVLRRRARDVPQRAARETSRSPPQQRPPSRRPGTRSP
jgi:hypothetical protein